MILHVVYEKKQTSFYYKWFCFSVSPFQIRKFLQFGITKAESSARGGLENKNMGKDFLIPSFFIYTELYLNSGCTKAFTVTRLVL